MTHKEREALTDEIVEDALAMFEQHDYSTPGEWVDCLGRAANGVLNAVRERQKEGFVARQSYRRAA